MHYTKWYIIFCFIYIASSIKGYKAIVVSSIVDLAGTPLAAEEFQSMPLCGGQKEPFVACKRGHQLLFNEVIDVVDQTADHVCVAVPNIFYIAQDKDKKYNRYWTEKKHVLPLDTICNTTNEHDKIPQPLNHSCATKRDGEAVLISPHHDPTINLTFSIGTRFMRTHPHKKEKKISVWIFDPRTSRFKTIHIPTTKCHLPTSDSYDKRIAQFTQLVRNWAHLKNGYIPYVWGGSSTNQLAHSHTITEKYIRKNNKEASYYCINNYNACPMSGFDCSSLVSRAAQICNIPYFFKNTTTLAHYLDPIDTHNQVQNGDLIWIPWHVMIVSDVKKNLLVEARSYNHGYGKVHELPICKVFKGVRTYQELTDRIRAKKPIERIDKFGKVMDTFWTFKILKTKTVFKTISSKPTVQA